MTPPAHLLCAAPQRVIELTAQRTDGIIAFLPTLSGGQSAVSVSIVLIETDAVLRSQP